jgi:hypothetical protein
MEEHVEPKAAPHEHAEQKHTESVGAGSPGAENPGINFEPERFTTLEFLSQMLQGIGIAVGLALLWLMETVRNSYFRLLDRMNVKPRRSRKISPFPPGKHPRPHPEPGV